MYLKRLEIQGFKSFPEKIRLDFREGITAVVGPNGSGKSNISDALRWVLGEQSAKSLRGGRMEDVIFAGTQERKPVGFAEVSITIDNTDRRLAPEYSEIKVTRRIFRMGEGEFALNGVTCRLKDIHAAFMDTGLGREGYSIVGQGRIDEIIGSRVETRRYLFEEAAGIVKFKTRKTEAEDKLAREAANLVRLDDILEELGALLPSLAAQAEKARDYLGLRERQKHILANLFLVDIANADERLAKLHEAKDVAASQSEAEESERARLEEEYAIAREDDSRLEADIKAGEAALADNRLAIEQHDNDVRLNEEQCRGLSVQISQAESRFDKSGLRLEELEQSLEGAQVRYAELADVIAARGERLARLEEQAAGQVAEMTRDEQSVDELNARLIESVKLSSQLEGKAANIKEVIQGLEERKTRLDEEAGQCGAAASESGAALGLARDELREADERFVSEEQTISELEARRIECEASVAENTREMEKARRALGEAGARRRVLTELKDSFEGYTRAVKVLMRERTKYPGMLGTVGELCRPEAGYETAIEVSLGAALQNIITIDEKAANTAIEYLKAAKAGRVTFLPLSAIRSQPVISRTDMLGEDGVCGTALGLASYDPRFTEVFKSLLGRTLVVDTMENAVRFARKYNQSVRVVTLTGELLSVGGAITGGSRGERSAGLFERGREIGELEQSMELLGEKARSLDEEVQGANAKLQEIIREIEGRRSRHEETGRSRQTCAERVSKLEAELAAVYERSERLAAEDEDLVLQLGEAAAHKSELESQSLEAKSAAREAEAEIAALQSSLQSYREDRDERTGELTELKVELGSREQEQLAVGADRDRLEREMYICRAEMDELRLEIASNTERLSAKRETIAELAAAKDVLTERGREMTERLEAFEIDRARSRTSLQSLENAGRTIGETLAKLQSELVRLTLQHEHAGDERRKLFDAMWEDYQLTPAGARAYPRLEESVEKLRREERDIRANIGQMGSVNVDAIEEYKSVRSRVEQMTGQRDDILAAREDLQALIRELEELMERQFTEQFELISESFGVVFRQMFGGGKAYLRLLDQDNALESGIDIIAQPPGKALASMSLLSGGERALTALALLFGILRMKPSPFVILDEVESALDDANVARFAAFLKDVAARDTQFIMITHRRGAMEVADALYGVTMQERGVSKVVSVEL
ncbi:MAG: chromosome segregation protein SMC [Defluviitaleaceae bacterium]|nr:chromosome segregation protein SMC [Defluviitaleaceae bacterium]